MILEKLQLFQRLSKRLTFLQKFLQNFIIRRQVPGRSKIDFWRDYQQILKKHKEVYFTRTIREI